MNPLCLYLVLYLRHIEHLMNFVNCGAIQWMPTAADSIMRPIYLQAKTKRVDWEE